MKKGLKVREVAMSKGRILKRKDIKHLNRIGMKGMYFDMQGKPIGLGDWANLLESKKRIIGRTKVGEYIVSTVWLGLSNTLGKPRGIFETMVFDKKHM